jgi:hypothetical protein
VSRDPSLESVRAIRQRQPAASLDRVRGLAPVALVSLLLVACGGGGEDGGPSSTSTTIHSFTASVASSTAVPVPVSPYQDNGVFSLAWSVASSDPYHITLYVSTDALLQTTVDRQLFSQNCGAASLYACHSQATATCQFDTMNRVTCSLPASQPQVTDLTSFLTSLPQQAYIILRACDGLFGSCMDAAVSVEFQ